MPSHPIVDVDRGPKQVGAQAVIEAPASDRAVEWGHFGKHTWRWKFEPIDDASTTVTEIFDHRRSPLSAGLERSGMVANNHKSIRASLHQLQQRFSTSS